MVINESSLQSLPTKDGFRLRGSAMTRLEAFSDAAFAFAMTMLVISVGNIPGSYHELLHALKGIPTFAASFASIMAFWMAHRTWSQRYGLEDAVSTLLSLSLVFIVLVYLYPLKIAFSVFFTWISGGWLPTDFAILASSDIIGVFIIYGLGLAALSACLVLLYLHALRLTPVLLLDERERIKTTAVIAVWTVMTLTGGTSAIFAWATPLHISVYAGFVYFSLAVTMPVTAVFYERKLKLVSPV